MRSSAERRDPLTPLLRQLEPRIAAVVEAMPFRTLLAARTTIASPVMPEIEAVVLVDAPLSGARLAELVELTEAAEVSGRVVLLVAADATLRDGAKRRLSAALDARRHAGGGA